MGGKYICCKAFIIASHVSGIILYTVERPIREDHFFDHTLSA